MTGAGEWTGRVGHAWAEEWRRTDRSFGVLTDLLLEVGGFTDALDIGCGAGELTERLARAYPAGSVTGVDISPQLTAVARDRCAALANVSIETADASAWRAHQGRRPDLLVSRHGVMFFPDPVATFAHLRAQAAPSASLRFSCFRARSDNGWAAALASALPPQSDPDLEGPGPFAFADAARVTAILEAAGWQAPAFTPIDYAMIAGEGRDAAMQALAYFQRIGPAARVLAELPDRDRPAALAALRHIVAAHDDGRRVAMPAAAWIVTAIASGGREP